MNTEQADQDPSDNAAYSPPQRRGSLKRRLLAWFLAAALLPLTVVSAISYYTAKESLRAAAAAVKSLSASVREKAGFISNWFHYRLVDLESQATSVSNARFLGELSHAFRAGGKNLEAFVKSYRWTAVVDERSEDIKTFQKLYGYNDVYLLDTEGNILYTVARQSDLGANLFDGPLAETRFAAACRAALTTGRPAFSDLEYYAPSNDAVAGFLAELIVDESGEKIGILAIQLAYERIEDAMRTEEGLNADVQSYLVGQSPGKDGVTLRTALAKHGLAEHAADNMDSESVESTDYLKYHIDTEQTRLWMKEHDSSGTKTETTGALEDARVYEGPNGEAVLGVHMDIAIAAVTWGVIAEIPARQAFAQAQDLGITVLLLVIATGAIVIVIGTIITSRIVRPITRLSTAAQLVAQGDLTQKIDSEGSDEISELAGCFNWMISSLSKLFGDLRTRGKEMEEQAEKLKIANEASAKGEANSKGILESAADAIITIDAEGMRRQFAPLAERKGLTLKIDLADGLPETLATDGQKVEQVLRNLFSNAFKFTQTGSITLRVSRPDVDIRFLHSELGPDTAVAFSVIDTGIGIPEGKRKVIFESFQQADGSTSRKYGGTGLGLSISREFAKLLGGELLLSSHSGTGSTFIL